MKRFVLPLLLLACASARAATLTVTSLADDGLAGTLRAVVASAQDGDVVTFDSSLRGGTMTIVKRGHADTGIPVSASISIVGPADRSIALDGGFYGTNPSADIGSTILQATDPDAIPKEVSLEEKVRLLEMQNKILRFHLSAQLERGQQSSPEDVGKKKR